MVFAYRYMLHLILLLPESKIPVPVRQTAGTWYMSHFFVVVPGYQALGSTVPGWYHPAFKNMV